jgi:hypothetical protein
MSRAKHVLLHRTIGVCGNGRTGRKGGWLGRLEAALAEARRPWLAKVLKGLRRKGS